MERLYDHIITQHFDQTPYKMLFLVGPRQVGKTTCSNKTSFTNQHYFNWDNVTHREQIIEGPEAIANIVGLNELQQTIPLVIFDEIHKYRHWRTFLKGLYDSYQSKLHIIVTGSARLNHFRKGGDSLMGRYFPYRLFPITLAEAIDPSLPTHLYRQPKISEDDTFERLLNFGGYPEPFLQQKLPFHKKWQKLQQSLLFNEDIRDLTNIMEIDQLELLSTILSYQSGELVNYSSLAKHIRVTNDTIRRWIIILESFYYCFRIRPYHTNIPRSLLKEPKCYLWDWSTVNAKGHRIETMVAVHLYKYTQTMNDLGLGEFSLHFLRDKQKREVDFMITKEEKPWVLLEVKSSSSDAISKNLFYFQEKTNAPHAFQLIADAPYVDQDCFTHTEPIKVPLRTFLSQLL